MDVEFDVDMDVDMDSDMEMAMSIACFSILAPREVGQPGLTREEMKETKLPTYERKKEPTGWH